MMTAQNVTRDLTAVCTFTFEFADCGFATIRLGFEFQFVHRFSCHLIKFSLLFFRFFIIFHRFSFQVFQEIPE